MSGELEKRLQAFEEMYEAVKKEHTEIIRKMEQLKEEGKVNSATYKQLMGRKLMYTNMLSLYKLYDL